MKKYIILSLILSVLIFTGCGSQEHKHEEKKAHNHEGHDHGEGGCTGDHEGHDHGAESTDDHNHLHLDAPKLKEYGITTGLPEMRTFINSVNLTGSLTDNVDNTYDVTTRSEGIIEKFHKNIGDKVKRGTSLYRINSPELLEKKSSFIKAYQTYRLNKDSYDRAVKLSSIKGLEKSELQRRETEYKTSMAELFSLQGELNSRGLSLKTLEKVKAAVKNNSTKEIEAFLSPFHNVTAKAAGTVIARTGRIGEEVEKSKVIFTISDTSSLWGIFDATREQIKHLSKNRKVNISTDIYPDKKFSGHITTIMEKMDAELRTLKVRVEIDNPENLLKPQMFATASIEIAETEKRLAVPVAAIVKVSGIDGIFVQDGDGFDFKALEKVEYDSTGFAFISGISEEALIVVKGAFYIKAEFEIKTGGTDPHAGHNH